jgi:hypothetical protein
VSVRRILPLLTLFALLIAPFGRMAAAEASAMPHHGAAMTAGHCEGMPQPDPGKTHKMSVDCALACAAIAPPETSALAAPPLAATAPVRLARSIHAGLHPESDPPPPRFS